MGTMDSSAHAMRDSSWYPRGKYLYHGAEVVKVEADIHSYFMGTVYNYTVTYFNGRTKNGEAQRNDFSVFLKSNNMLPAWLDDAKGPLEMVETWGFVKLNLPAHQVPVNLDGRDHVCFVSKEDPRLSCEVGTFQPAMKVFALQLAITPDDERSNPVVMTATELPFEFSVRSFDGVEHCGMWWLRKPLSGGDQGNLEVLTATIEEMGGVLQVCLTNLGGTVLAKKGFPMNAMVLDLEGMIMEQRPAWRALNFYSDDGSRANRTDCLLDYCRLTCNHNNKVEVPFHGLKTSLRSVALEIKKQRSLHDGLNIKLVTPSGQLLQDAGILSTALGDSSFQIAGSGKSNAQELRSDMDAQEAYEVDAKARAFIRSLHQRVGNRTDLSSSAMGELLQVAIAEARPNLAPGVAQALREIVQWQAQAEAVANLERQLAETQAYFDAQRLSYLDAQRLYAGRLPSILPY